MSGHADQYFDTKYIQKKEKKRKKEVKMSQIIWLIPIDTLLKEYYV